MTKEHPLSTARESDVAGLPPDPVDRGVLRVLLVEDDAGDALLVEDMLESGALQATLTHVRSLREAREVLSDDITCVLLDLGLPDANGLEALHAVLQHAPRAAVIVLTGLLDEHRGIRAVAAGAQDYLVKGKVDGEVLPRAIRFAVERRRAEETTRRLDEVERVARENARLERGLLPGSLLRNSDVDCHTRYKPGRRHALLGGDFYDVLQAPDGSVFALIGDVSGHGPDEAALGVSLRIAWRTLVLAETPPARILPTLDEVLVRERPTPGVYATVYMAVVASDRRTAQIYQAGHPPAILLAPDDVYQLPLRPRGPALGLFPGPRWPALEVALPDAWSLMLYTDGLFECRTGLGTDRLGEEGLVELISRIRSPDPVVDGWLDQLLDAVEQMCDGALADDLAIVMLSSAAGRQQ